MQLVLGAFLELGDLSEATHRHDLDGVLQFCLGVDGFVDFTVLALAKHLIQ